MFNYHQNFPQSLETISDSEELQVQKTSQKAVELFQQEAQQLEVPLKRRNQSKRKSTSSQIQ